MNRMTASLRLFAPSILLMVLGVPVWAADIITDTTWSTNQVVSGTVIVRSGATLTILPGVQVAFNAGAKLQIGKSTSPTESGTLVAVGASGNPIRFVKNGTSKWVGIELTTMAGVDSEVRFCEVVDGGSTTTFAAVDIKAPIAAFSDVSVQLSQNDAIKITGFQGGTIGNLSVSGFGANRTGIAFTGASPVVTGTNSVSGSGTGLSFAASGTTPSSPTISNLTVSNVSSYALDAAPPSGSAAGGSPQFVGSLQVAGSGAKLARGGGDFWANFFAANPLVTGTGYAQEVIGGELNRNTTWGNQSYIGSITVKSSLQVRGKIGSPAVLTLAPNTTIDFLVGASITVNTGAEGVGSLIAQGTSGQEIVFRGLNNAAWLGINIGTNGDGVPSPGTVFQHCIFEDTSTACIQLATANSLFPNPVVSIANCEFRDITAAAIQMGSRVDATLDWLYIHDTSAGINAGGASDGSISISNSTFSVSGDAITATGDSISSIRACSFQDADKGIVGNAASAIVVENCQFSDWDITAIDGGNGGFWDIKGCQFNGAGSYALHLPAVTVHLFSQASPANTFQPTGPTEIRVSGGTPLGILEQDAIWKGVLGSGGQQIPYRLMGAVQYQKTLTILEGTTIRLDGSATDISASGTAAKLIVQGSAAAKVVFESATGSNWEHILLAGGSYIEHAKFDKGGSGGDATLQLNGPDPCILRHCEVTNSAGMGIFQNATTAMTGPTWIEDCLVTGSVSDGIRCSAFSRVNLLRSSSTGNTGYGLKVLATTQGASFVDIREGNLHGNVGAVDTQTNASVDAAYCYWGDASGPGGSGPGSGGTITGGGTTSFNPWFATQIAAPFWVSDPSFSPMRFRAWTGSMTFAGKLTQPGSWLLEGFNSSGQQKLRVPGSGSSFNILWKGNQYIITPPNQVAYGLGALPAGLYDITMTTTSSTPPNPQSILKGEVELDDTALVAKLSTPTPLAFVVPGGSLSIVGKASGAVFGSYVLDYGLGSQPSSFTQIWTSTQPVIDDELSRTPFVVPSAPVNYLLLRLRVSEASPGTETNEDTRLLRVLTFQELEAVPSLFSPDGDNYLDATTLTGSITWASSWTAEVMPAGGGAVIRTFSGSGTQIALTWDGKDGSGVLQPEGSYKIRLTATSTENSAVVATDENTMVQLGNSSDLIAIASPASGSIVSGSQNAVVITDAIPSGLDFTLRLEYGNDPTWNLVKTWTELDNSLSTTWDVTALVSGNYDLRATLFLPDGTVASDSIPIQIRNLTLTVGNRVFDPFNAETTSIQVGDGQGAGSNGTLLVKAYEANTDYEQVSSLTNWLGKYIGKGNQVWSQTSAFTDGSGSVLWNGKDSGGVALPAREYVFEAEVTYPSGQKAYFEQAVEPYNTATPANSFLSGLIVSFPQGSPFDPYYGDRVDVQFALSEPAWITIADSDAGSLGMNANPGIIPKLFHAAGSQVFPWDGRRFEELQLAFPDEAGASFSIGIKAAEVPPTLTALVNKTLVLNNAYFEPIAIHPDFGQTTNFHYTLQGRSALVTAKVYDTVNSEEGVFYKTLFENVLQAPGSYAVSWDGRDEAGAYPNHDGTYAIRIEAKDPTVESYQTVLQKSIRLHR